MAHLDCRLRDSASIIDLGQLPPASPASSCDLNHPDKTLAIRAKSKAGGPKNFLTHRLFCIGCNPFGRADYDWSLKLMGRVYQTDTA